MKDIIGYLQMFWLMRSPPDLFSRLFKLPWYGQMLVQWVEPVQDGNAAVLEIGCATGDFSRLLAERNMRVSAVDRSKRMLAKAKLVTDAVRFAQADAEMLPYPDRHFDIVMAASLLNVVDAPLAVLAQMRRVCREGGAVTELVPDKSFSDADARLAAKILTGFSRAAFLTWHRIAKKMDAVVLMEYFKICGLQNVTSRRLLGGMVVAVEGVVMNYNEKNDT
jgi:ubiquinone/menaquinone biosynthesis C-methylase UbiE